MEYTATRLTLSGFLFAGFVVSAPTTCFASAYSWTGKQDNSLINKQNWSPKGVPTASDDIYVGDVAISSQMIIPANTTVNFNSITIGGTAPAGLTINGSLSIATDVTVVANGTLTQNAGSTLAFNGNFNCQGTYNGSTTSTTVLSSLNAVITGTNSTFGNLVLLAGTATVSAPLTIAGTLTLYPLSVLDLGVYPLIGTITSVSGTMAGTGSIKTQNTSSTPVPSGVSWGGPVYYNATAPQTIVDGSYSTIDASGGNRTLSPTGTIAMTGNFTPGTGSYTITGSTVSFNGTSNQNIPSFSFNNLSISNPAGVFLTGAVSVKNALGFGNVNNSVIRTNGQLTLSSSASNTANFLDVTNGGVNWGNSINGVVTIERYIPGKRAYRFLSAPINSTTTIRANWMENTNNAGTSVNNDPVPGYGTHITGAGGNTNHFDATSTNNPSLFTFNNATQAWVAVTNTDSFFVAGSAYRIMVRGNRSVNLNSNVATTSNTILRATGTVKTGLMKFTKAGGGGTAGMAALSAVTGAYNFIANPYPSVVNFDSLAKTDIDSSVYIYDPTISGSNGRGGYVAYNSVQRRNNNASSQVSNDIQSGQAFFVQSTGPNPSLTFRENYKETTVRSVFRTTEEIPNLSVQLLLPGQETQSVSADGTAVYFSDNYSNAVAGDDSYKFTNLDENIAILRDGKYLSLEGRKPFHGSDSIPLIIWQLSQKSYTFKVTAANFADNVEGYLQDKYLNITTPIANGATLIPFNITSDAASGASDRFKVVFETMASLPVKLTGVKAYAKDKGVEVDWAAESESNMIGYEVERSPYAQNFKTVASLKAKNISAISSAYSWFDAEPFTGDNYYRIKSVEKSGDIKESTIVRVTIAAAKNTVSIANNPVTGNSITLLFNGAEKGTYTVALFNQMGEKVFLSNISYDGGKSYKQLNLKSYLPKGIYQLQLILKTSVKNLPILVE